MPFCQATSGQVETELRQVGCFAFLSRLIFWKIMLKISTPWVFLQGFMVGIYGVYIDIFIFTHSTH